MTRPSLLFALVLAALPAAAHGALNAPPLRPGWPATLAGAGTVRVSQPAVGDLDNDGVKEIVVGTSNRRVYVLRANGSVAPGWPVTLSAEVNSSPALGDIDGDGFLDVVVACGSNFETTSGVGRLYVFRRDGSLLWSFTPQDENGDGRADGIYSTPAIGDVDGDGDNEIAFGSWDFRVYVLRKDGTPMPGFPRIPRGSATESATRSGHRPRWRTSITTENWRSSSAPTRTPRVLRSTRPTAERSTSSGGTVRSCRAFRST